MSTVADLFWVVVGGVSSFGVVKLQPLTGETLLTILFLTINQINVIIFESAPGSTYENVSREINVLPMCETG